MATATIGDIDLYYEVHGDGPSLMLVAGLGSDSQSWQPVLGDLAKEHRVVVWDNRGVGRTKPLRVETGIRRMALDCLALADHLELESFHLLGHSMGGLIAIECARIRPHAVNRLILAGIALPGPRRNLQILSDWAAGLASGMDRALWFRSIFYWIFAESFFEDEAAVEEAVRGELAYPYPLDPVAFANQVRALDDYVRTGDAVGIETKTLVIGARNDLLFSPEECRKLAETIPGAEFRLIEGAGHSLFMENPKDFAACVGEFLRR